MKAALPKRLETLIAQIPTSMRFADRGVSIFVTFAQSITFETIILLEIRKSQDLAKDFGGTASKAEKKICQSKIVSYI